MPNINKYQIDASNGVCSSLSTILLPTHEISSVKLASLAYVFVMPVGTVLHKTVEADVDLPNGLAFWGSHNNMYAISIYFDLKWICMSLKRASKLL